jgi:hypothetical protein
MWRNLFILVFLLTGCSALVPTEKQKSQSVSSAEAISTQSEKTTRRTMSVVPEMVAKITQGDGTTSRPVAIREELEETSRVSTGAGSKDAAKGSSETKQPLWVKIVGVAIGLLLLVAAIKYAITAAKGTAFGSAIALGDRFASDALDHLSLLLASAKDDGEIARLSAFKSQLEKGRGKLKGGK